MSIIHWRGDAPAVAQQTHITPTNVQVGDQFQLAINGKQVSYTATASTVDNVTAGLAAAWNSSKVPEHAEVVNVDLETHLALQALRPGVPFLVSASTQDGGGDDDQQLLVSTPVANSGPHDWNTPANWSTGALPTTGDQVVIEQSQRSILYGLDQSSVVLESLTIGQSFTGTIGLPRTNSAGYVEYREQYLTIQAAHISIGGGEGAGSGRIRLNTLTGQTVLDVLNTGVAADAMTEAIQWKGVHADNIVNVVKGSLAIAPLAGEIAQLELLRVGFRNSQSGDAIVRCGATVALSAVEQAGGAVTIAADVDTARIAGGELRMTAGAIDTLLIEAGTVRFESPGDIAQAHIGQQGTLDFSRDLRPRSIGFCHLYPGARLLDPFKTVTFATGLQLVRAGLAAVTLDLGTNRTLLVS